MNRWHVIPFLCLSCTLSFGQFNLKAGYALSFVEADIYNGIIQAHQDNLAGSYEEGFNPLKVLHGMDVGLEYRWDKFAIEGGWRVKRNRQEGSGVHESRTFQNKLGIGMGSFYGGIVQYLGPVRIAASVDYAYLRNRVRFEEPVLDHVYKSQSWGSQFSVGYVFNGSGPVSLAIAPFVQVTWSDYDLTEFQEAITGNSTAVGEDFFVYGINLFFLNGPR